MTACTGANGEDGRGSLVSVSAEPAGANCAEGGQRIDTGVDDNGNGTLDAGEVDATTYVCNGGTGTTGSTGASTLVSVSPEAAGANCALGGQRVDAGVDDDGDGTLDPAEVDSTAYVCTGMTGQDGAHSLVDVTVEPQGANCEAGGYRIDTGIDDDDDNTLDQNEIDHTAYVCHGTCLGSSTLEYSGALATFAVPACARNVTIEAWGAQGGGGLGNVVGGRGAYISGSFTGLYGKTLTVLVGGQGVAGTDNGQQAGGTGGGGTFVVDGASPLVVAGGGGGAMGRSGLLVNGGPGQTTTAGQAGALNGGAGGINGGGGATWPWSGWHSGTGGGGFTGNGSAPSNGNTGSFGTINGPGIAFVNGGAGGSAGSWGRAGGFGGGGAAGFTGGGGGGYSGGGSGTHDEPQTYNGGGGGSFNAGTDPQAQSGAREGHGLVVITWD